MKASLTKRIGILIAFLLLTFFAVSFRIAYREIQQQRLNHALIAAIKQNNTQAALTLLAQGADPNSRDEPIQSLSLWRLLLDKLRGKSSTSSKAPTALLLALGSSLDLASPGMHIVPGSFPYKSFPLVEALLDRGADANVTDEKGNTPLMLLSVASMVNKRESDHIFQLLIEHGANINEKLLGYTLLGSAVEDEDTNMVKWLLLHHANPNIRCGTGETPLKLAMWKQNQQIIQMLKQAGAKE